MSKETTLQVEVIEEDADAFVEATLDPSITEMEDDEKAPLTQSEVEATLDPSTTEMEDAEKAPLTQSEKDLECAQTTKKNAECLLALNAGHFFLLYANLLSEDARFQWD